MKISVFIITLNEAKNIRSCLESIRWADEIVVVDMKSDDATSAIAKEYTEKVFSFERTGYCEPARQYAYEQTTGEWILNLDADELMTAPLRDELRRIVKEKALPTTLKGKRSVLRVSLSQNTLSVQKTGLERLTPHNRKILIDILMDLMGELEQGCSK